MDEQIERLNINEQKDRKELQYEKERLELEQLRAEVRTLKQKEAVEILRKKNQQRQAEITAINEKTKQAGCNHKTGGEGLRALSTGGDDPNYCLAKNQYPWGVMHVLCQRCGKEWKPGDPDYDWAMTAPTKYSATPSVACQFTFSKGV